MRCFMTKKHFFCLLLFFAVAGCLTFGCKTKKPDESPAVTGSSSSAESDVSAAVHGESTTLQAGEAAPSQSGKLQEELLSEYDLFATVTGYAFYPDNKIDLSVSARNESGNPGTIWVGFSTINGWSVGDISKSVTILQLAPGESQEATVSFDLSTESGKAMDIRALSDLAISCEGYLDSSQYEYYSRLVNLDFSSDNNLPAQEFGTGFQILSDNEYVEIGLLPESESYAVLYLNIKSAVEDAKIDLFPIENGNFNASLYPMPYSYPLNEVCRKIITISSFGSPVAHPDGFGIIYRGLSLPSECSLNGEPGAMALANELISRGSTLEMSYSRDDNLLIARSLDSSQALLLTISPSWIRNGVELRSNPLSVPIFPGTSTCFRISGRGVGQDGVARSFQYDSDTVSATADFPVYLLDSTDADASPLETIHLELGSVPNP